jgi:hypothetical protein
MVEIHLVRFEDAAAVGARPLAQCPQEPDGRVLAVAHAPYLAFPVLRVVRDVGRALVATFVHGSV